MTSLILTMNARGVAFATDSAVTYGNHSRNSAQKLFSLSGRQPVAFMVMGNGNYAPANLSWSRIFYNYNLHYGKKYGEEFELDTIEDYQIDFVNFLDSLESREDNDYALFNDMCDTWCGSDPYVIDGSLGYYISKQEKESDEEDGYFEFSNERKGLNSIKNMLQDWLENASIMDKKKEEDIGFLHNVKRVSEEHEGEINNTAQWIIRKSVAGGKMPLDYEEMRGTMDLEMKKEIDELIMPGLRYLISRWLADVNKRTFWKKRQSSSGVIFGGFGKKDVYPCTVELSTGSRIRGIGDTAISEIDKNKINPRVTWPIREDGVWTSMSFLESFAQNDFIVRITTGLESYSMPRKVDSMVEESLEEWIKHSAIENISQVKGVSNRLATEVSNQLLKYQEPKSEYQSSLPEEIVYKLGSYVSNIGRTNKQEFRMAIARLEPHELASLSSSLIEVQATLHNIVNSQASVDLPVDVCYLSRETGFVWHTRKNMPDVSINPKISTMEWKGSQLD